MSINIFKNQDAKKLFSKLYHNLTADKQRLFGELIREKADEKVTRLDLVDDFYVDMMDVQMIYNSIMKIE